MKFSTKKTLLHLLFFCAIIFPKNILAATFSDVPSTQNNYTAIEALVSQGILKGYSDGTFQPNKAINRVETLKILLLGAQIDVPETTFNGGFPDVISNAWYAKYVVKAKENGVVKGNPNGYFYPDNQVNFAEALKMIALTNQVDLKNELNSNPFQDVPLDAWYAPYFQYAKENNIIQKSSSTEVQPAKLLSRGELAELVFLFQEAKNNPVTEQLATYYADALEGNATASGEFFLQTKLTAAHKTLPFGTKIRVTNLENNESVVVTINDRGPYSSNPAFVLDLSKSAFQAISPLSRGSIKIKYEIVEETTSTNTVSTENTTTKNETLCTYEKRKIPVDFYQNISLDAELPNLYQKNEIYLISGKVTTQGVSKATVFLYNITTGQQENRFTGDVINQHFSIPVRFAQTGNLSLGILEGEFGQSYIYDVTILGENCKKMLTKSALAPSNLQIKIVENQTVLTWKNQGQRLSKIELWQSNQKNTYLLNNAQESFQIPYQDFQNFSKGQVFYRISSALSDSIFSIDQASEWSSSPEQTFIAVLHQQDFNDWEKISLKSTPTTYKTGETIQITGTAQKNINAEASLILPTGFVENIGLKSSSYTLNKLNQQIIPAGIEFKLFYTPTLPGTQILEINGDDGFALINMPLYQEGNFPLLPDLWDYKEHYLTGTKSIKLDQSRQELLNLINQSRSQLGFSQLVLNNDLNSLAQSRTDDMVNRNYFAHKNPDGLYANDLKSKFNIKTSVSENIAKDIDIEFIHAGLMRSAIHRENILDKKWTRVGIGITLNKDGYLIVTEEFAAEEMTALDFPQLRSQVLETINQNRAPDLVADTILNNIAQDWSSKIQEYPDSWFEDPKTGLNLSYYIDKQISNKLTGSTILKGDFAAILENIEKNQTLQDTKWSRLGTGISQNQDGILNLTLIYTE